MAATSLWKGHASCCAFCSFSQYRNLTWISEFYFFSHIEFLTVFKLVLLILLSKLYQVSFFFFLITKETSSIIFLYTFLFSPLILHCRHFCILFHLERWSSLIYLLMSNLYGIHLPSFMALLMSGTLQLLSMLSHPVVNLASITLFIYLL